MSGDIRYSIGFYNPKTELTNIQYKGVKQPTSVQILTIPQLQESTSWSDAGYEAYSGPITAVRIHAW